MSKAITSRVQFTFVSVFEKAKQPSGNEEMYEVTLLIDKSDKKTKAALDKAFEEAIEEGISKGLLTRADVKSPKFWSPLRDGDEEKPDYDMYKNRWFLKSKSKFKPQVIDRSGKQLQSDEEFYSGCYGAASLNAFAYKKAGQMGVSTSLNNLIKLADGPRMGGAMNAVDEFEEFLDEAGADQKELLDSIEDDSLF